MTDGPTDGQSNLQKLAAVAYKPCETSPMTKSIKSKSANTPNQASEIVVRIFYGHTIMTEEGEENDSE